jgi:hypothetical protein
VAAGRVIFLPVDRVQAAMAAVVLAAAGTQHREQAQAGLLILVAAAAEVSAMAVRHTEVQAAAAS